MATKGGGARGGVLGEGLGPSILALLFAFPVYPGESQDVVLSPLDARVCNSRFLYIVTLIVVQRVRKE